MQFRYDDVISRKAWIASAMLEKVSGKLQQARNIIIKGTEVNPDSEEIWEEAIKLVAPAQQKSLAAQAVNAIPNSVKLWIQACGLESDKKSKRKAKTLGANSTGPPGLAEEGCVVSIIRASSRFGR